MDVVSNLIPEAKSLKETILRQAMIGAGSGTTNSIAHDVAHHQKINLKNAVNQGIQQGSTQAILGGILHQANVNQSSQTNHK